MVARECQGVRELVTATKTELQQAITLVDQKADAIAARVADLGKAPTPSPASASGGQRRHVATWVQFGRLCPCNQGEAHGWTKTDAGQLIARASMDMPAFSKA